MKKLAVSLFGFVLLLFAFSVSAVYAQVECNKDAECEDGFFCTVNSCSSDGSVCIILGDPCQPGEICDDELDRCVVAGCDNDTQCDDEVFCNGMETCNETVGFCEDGAEPCQEPLFCIEEEEICVECRTDRDCGDSTPYCDNETLSCVECVDDFDCDDNETCSEGVCEVPAPACELKVRPRKVRVSKMFRPVERRFKISGGEGFDPYGAIDFGMLTPYIKKTKVNKKGTKLKVRVKTPTGMRLYKGPLEIRVGDCVGEVMFK